MYFLLSIFSGGLWVIDVFLGGLFLVYLIWAIKLAQGGSIEGGSWNDPEIRTAKPQKFYELVQFKIAVALLIIWAVAIAYRYYDL